MLSCLGLGIGVVASLGLTRLIESSGMSETQSLRFYVRLLSIFAGLALFLAAVGLFGVTSYSVAQRTHEFGLRRALGAQRSDILRSVLKEGLVLSCLGLGIGVNSGSVSETAPRQIVGIVGDIINHVREEAKPGIFVPYRQYSQSTRGQFYSLNKGVVIRTATEPMSLADAVRDAVSDTDPELTMSPKTRPERSTARLVRTSSQPWGRP